MSRSRWREIDNRKKQASTFHCHAQAARRWVEAVNAEGSYGLWIYAVAHKPEEGAKRIEEAIGAA